LKKIKPAFGFYLLSKEVVLQTTSKTKKVKQGKNFRPRFTKIPKTVNTSTPLREFEFCTPCNASSYL